MIYQYNKSKAENGIFYCPEPRFFCPLIMGGEIKIVTYSLTSGRPLLFPPLEQMSDIINGV